MRYALLIAALILPCCSLGCGDSPDAVPGAKNGGNMVPLPDKTGFVEVRVDGAAGTKSAARRGKGQATSIVVYFYGPDGTTPLSPSPTDVTIKVGRGEAMPLDAGASDGSFVSKPGDFPPDGFRGTLAAKVGGVPIEATVMVR